MSHYAARLAAAHPDRKLLLHIRGPQGEPVDVDSKIDRIHFECRRLNVVLHDRTEPLSGSVVKTLLSVIPSGGDSCLTCGIRSHHHNRPLLSGTVAAVRTNDCSRCH